MSDEHTHASYDTTTLNRHRQDLSGVESVWLFGYGSLLYKVDFPYRKRRPATLHGWTRRLWQGSHDHRGTPARPGWVATLVRDAGAECAGMAYRVAPATFECLDYREKNGYLRVAAPLAFDDGHTADGLVYIASDRNPAWLGYAGEAAIARDVARSAGPSGANSDYVFRLAAALRELGARDPHVFAVEAHLRALDGADGRRQARA